MEHQKLWIHWRRIISPLICVFWIQLTRTNAVFSRIALVSCFCAEIWLSGKIPENIAKILFYQKTHGARVRDGEGPAGHHTTWWRGPGQATLGGGVAAPAISSSPLPPTYTLWPENISGSEFFPDRVPLRHHDQKPRFRTRNSFRHPAGTGIWRGSSPSSSPTSLHQPPMIPPSMCE
jgi:hypothetical protein